MGMCYVYFKQITDRECAYLLAFINRETADEWWRMISTAASPYSGNVKRISSQYYAQNGVNGLALNATDPELPDAKLFSQKMFITLLDNQVYMKYSCPYQRSPILLPSIAITDHISGRWYFIRSKADPWSHWYLSINGECLVCGNTNCDAIHVSSEFRTRFCVRVRNLANDTEAPEDFVMIGKDEILIAGPKGYLLHIDGAGDLKAARGHQNETDLVFGDLKKRFISRGEKQVNGEIWEYVESVERGTGEPWELVD